MGKLFQTFPDADSLMFVPLEHCDRSRWLSATMVWDCERRMGDDDLNYLKVIGDLITCEIARIDGSSLEKSKSDLLSSISHELRSPLHGLLANTELLQSTDLDPTQSEMVTMVETCGKTLLDTMNCLLDFAKINTLTQTQKGSSNVTTDLNGLVTEFNLSSLVEEVANSVYAGHRHLNETLKSSGRIWPVQEDDWRIRSIPGAWRRIIMNTLGNALKFSQSGLIEVAVNRLQQKRHGRTSNFAHLKITDTGCGISQDYLKVNLFTPFSQQSILTEGVGLGMSITQQLVEHLGGYARVQSKLGVGTEVDIHIPVKFVQGESVSSDPDLNVRPNKPTSVHGQALNTDAKRKSAIRSWMSDLLSRHPDYQISFTEALNPGSGDIAVVKQSVLEAIPGGDDMLRSKFRSVIVLGGFGLATGTPRDRSVDGVNTVYIPQPYACLPIMIRLRFPQKLREITEAQCSPRTDDGDSPAAGPITLMPARSRRLVKTFNEPGSPASSQPAGGDSVSDCAPSLPRAPSGKPLHVLSIFLKNIGCTFETASDGLITLHIDKQVTRKYDYVLVDLCMRMDGITATSKIREYEEEHGLPRSAIMAATHRLSLNDVKRILNVS
ncbi:hypothetical protein BJX70DRAFT_391023 [Aspergillus crustosus]